MEVDKVIYIKLIHFKSEYISNSHILRLSRSHEIIEQNKNSQFCFILKYLNLQKCSQANRMAAAHRRLHEIPDDVISSSDSFQ